MPDQASDLITEHIFHQEASSFSLELFYSFLSEHSTNVTDDSSYFMSLLRNAAINREVFDGVSTQGQLSSRVF